MKRALPFLLLLSACSGNADDTHKHEPQPSHRDSTVISKNHLPEGFLPTKSLSDDAEAQFADTSRGYYIVVELESREDVDLALSDERISSTSDRLIRYVQIRQHALQIEHPDYSPEKPQLITYSGKTFISYPFSDNVEGIQEPVQYRFSFIEGGKGIYTITGWTLKSKSSDFQPAYAEFLGSFVPE